MDDLLLIAVELANRDSGRPKQASLRRATSSAYYALFHALAKLCADTFVGQKPWPVYTPVYRALDHKHARNVLERRRSLPIGLAFVKLQDARIEADYIPNTFRFSRQDVKDMIDEARNAIDAIQALSSDARIELAVALLTKARSTS